MGEQNQVIYPGHGTGTDGAVAAWHGAVQPDGIAPYGAMPPISPEAAQGRYGGGEPMLFPGPEVQGIHSSRKILSIIALVVACSSVVLVRTVPFVLAIAGLTLGIVALLREPSARAWSISAIVVSVASFALSIVMVVLVLFAMMAFMGGIS